MGTWFVAAWGHQVALAVQVSHQTRFQVILSADVLRLQLMPSAQVVVTRRWRRSSCRRRYLIHLHIHLPGPLHGPRHHLFHSHLGLPCACPRTAASGLCWCCWRAPLTVRHCVLMLSHRLTFVGCRSVLRWAGAHWLQYYWSCLDHLAAWAVCWAASVK